MFTIFQPPPTKEQNKNRKPPPVHGSSVHQRPKLRVHRWAPTNPLLVAGHMALGHWTVGGTTELMANTKIKVASLIHTKTCRKKSKSTPTLLKICSSFCYTEKNHPYDGLILRIFWVALDRILGIKSQSHPTIMGFPSTPPIHLLTKFMVQILGHVVHLKRN